MCVRAGACCTWPFFGLECFTERYNVRMLHLPPDICEGETVSSRCSCNRDRSSTRTDNSKGILGSNSDAIQSPQKVRHSIDRTDGLVDAHAKAEDARDLLSNSVLQRIERVVAMQRSRYLLCPRIWTIRPTRSLATLHWLTWMTRTRREVERRAVGAKCNTPSASGRASTEAERRRNCWRRSSAMKNDCTGRRPVLLRAATCGNVAVYGLYRCCAPMPCGCTTRGSSALTTAGRVHACASRSREQVPERASGLGYGLHCWSRSKPAGWHPRRRSLMSRRHRSRALARAVAVAVVAAPPEPQPCSTACTSSRYRRSPSEPKTQRRRPPSTRESTAAESCAEAPT